MKINVLFFANFKELLECSQISLEINDVMTVADVCKLLAKKGEAWSRLFSDPQASIKVAINQELGDLTSTLSNNDELAFFPPVTGG